MFAIYLIEICKQFSAYSFSLVIINKAKSIGNQERQVPDTESKDVLLQ